jgi:hypothetical protein
MTFAVTGRPGIAPGRLFFAFARKGVLMAFCGLLLFGGIGVPSPMRRAVVQGLTPGDTVRYPAQGVEGKNDEERGKRLCACAQSGSFVPKVAAKVAQFCVKVADSR